MQSSSSVGILGRHERFEPQQHQQFEPHQLPHRRSRAHNQQAQQPSSLVSTLYSQPAPPFYTQPFQQQQPKPPLPQSPPSPPGEDTLKPSLPSISSLLGMSTNEQQLANQSVNVQQMPVSAPHHATGSTQVVEHLSNTVSHLYAQPVTSKMSLPPTPPLGSESAVEGNQSPATVTSQSASPYYLGSTMNNLEARLQRQTQPADSPTKRHSIPSQASASPYQTAPYTESQYPHAPVSTSPYYTSEPQGPLPATMYAQQPLPSNFPPPLNISVPAEGPAANPWHHHYISASSQPAFSPTQDRYVCPTCNKAFSRPSSLRIHSHSHTGEKPFKCPHTGCGKAFSVRSNMKRHERGCHAIAAGSVPASN